MSIFTSNLRFMRFPPVVDVISPAFNEALSVGTVTSNISRGPVRQIPVSNYNSNDEISTFATNAGALATEQTVLPIVEGKDMVIGSRAMIAPGKGSLKHRPRFGNWLNTQLIQMLYGLRFAGLGPFRAIRRDKLVLLNIEDGTFGWPIELQVKALNQRLDCGKVPVFYRKRIGKSIISGTGKGILMDGFKILWTIVKWH